MSAKIFKMDGNAARSSSGNGVYEGVIVSQPEKDWQPPTRGKSSAPSEKRNKAIRASKAKKTKPRPKKESKSSEEKIEKPKNEHVTLYSISKNCSKPTEFIDAVMIIYALPLRTIAKVCLNVTGELSSKKFVKFARVIDKITIDSETFMNYKNLLLNYCRVLDAELDAEILENEINESLEL